MLQYNDNKILPYLAPFINLYDAVRHQYTKRYFNFTKTNEHGKVIQKYNGQLSANEILKALNK